MDSDDLKSAAAKSMEGSGDIRERVRELTLAAIRQRKFDFAGMKDVMHQVSDGITLGAERRGQARDMGAEEAGERPPEYEPVQIRGARDKRQQAAPGLKVTTKAFGMGRRIPIAQKFLE